MKSNNRVLLLTPYYAPGQKSGGSQRSTANIVNLLGDDISFSVITSDRDIGEKSPYSGIKLNSWQNIGKAEVAYLNAKLTSFSILYSLIKSKYFEVVHFNSFFSPYFTILPLVFFHFYSQSPRKILIATRGELDPGALKQKKIKKSLFIIFSKMTFLYSNVIFHAASKLEEKNIKNIFPKADVVIAPPPPSYTYDDQVDLRVIRKQSGNLRLVFMSRISPKKNLDGILNALKHIKSNIIFDIYGYEEDLKYTFLCKKIIKDLPSNISVKFLGGIPHEDVITTLSSYHVFSLVSHAENYGHVYLEALSSGLLLLSSKMTPWDFLDKEKVSISCNPQNENEIIKAIEYYASLSSNEFSELRQHALTLGKKFLKTDFYYKSNINIFRHEN